MKKIIDVKIGPMPMHLFDPMPEVKVLFDDNTSEVLFDYYPDEISFKKEDFLGLTRDAAIQLKFKKDVSYLK